MRARLLMLAIFCSKNYIPAAKKQIVQKKIDLQFLQSLLKNVLQFGKLDRGWICILL
jgi:hypothetical protein